MIKKFKEEFQKQQELNEEPQQPEIQKIISTLKRYQKELEGK